MRGRIRYCYRCKSVIHCGDPFTRVEIRDHYQVEERYQGAKAVHNESRKALTASLCPACAKTVMAYVNTAMRKGA